MLYFLFANRFCGSKSVFMLLCFTTHFVKINTNLKSHFGNFVISTHEVKKKFIYTQIYFLWMVQLNALSSIECCIWQNTFCHFRAVFVHHLTASKWIRNNVVLHCFVCVDRVTIWTILALAYKYKVHSQHNILQIALPKAPLSHWKIHGI